MCRCEVYIKFGGATCCGDPRHAVSCHCLRRDAIDASKPCGEPFHFGSNLIGFACSFIGSRYRAALAADVLGRVSSRRAAPPLPRAALTSSAEAKVPVRGAVPPPVPAFHFAGSQPPRPAPPLTWR